MTTLTTIILAAGDGTRMRSRTPKLMHKVAGLPIIGHVVRAAVAAGSDQIGVVTAPGATQIHSLVAELAPEARIFEQVEKLGTAHAAQMARDLYQNAEGIVAIVYGDHPLLTGQTFEAIVERLELGGNNPEWDAAILGFLPNDPSGYGRFVVDGERLLDIREHKDANEQERQIGLCNACILAFRAELFVEIIDKVENKNAQNEFYVPDLVKLANAQGARVTYAIAPAEDVVGVNSRLQLAEAESLYQDRSRRAALDWGVTLQDPPTTYFSYDTEVGQDVLIEPNVFIGPNVKIENDVTIKAFSHIEGAHVGAGAIVGPFARLRPGTELGEGSKVGNFCEIKKAVIGPGAKINHLSYIGDADIGARANIGAGTITCNYDGVNKHHTTIGEGAFVGSNTALVAPVVIGAGAMIAAGSTVTKDVGENDLALARGKQTNKPGYAARLRAHSLAKKNKK